MQGPPAQLLHCYLQQAMPAGSTPAPNYCSPEGSLYNMGGTSPGTDPQEAPRKASSPHETSSGHIPQHVTETRNVAPPTTSTPQQSEISVHTVHTKHSQLDDEKSPKYPLHQCARHATQNIKQANCYRPVTGAPLELPYVPATPEESPLEQGAPQCDIYYTAELALLPSGSAPRHKGTEGSAFMQSPCEVDRTIQVSGGRIDRAEQIERMYGLVRGHVSLPCQCSGCSSVGRPVNCWSVAGLLPSNLTVLYMLVLCVIGIVIFPPASAEKSFHHRDMSDEPILNPIMRHYSVSDFQAASVSFISYRHYLVHTTIR